MDENLKCVKLQSSKLLCHYLLCTTMEFEVSSQRMKSYGVSTHIPTKYTKHCFLAIVHCEYVVEASNVINDPKCNKGPKCNDFWP